MYEYVIVGAGFSGCVLAERIASQLNKKVLIIEKRNHIAGNAYDYYDEHGVLVHRYGPHIFHTNAEYVWNYLSQFTEWRSYFHRVLAVIDGARVPIPFNLSAIEKCFPKKNAELFKKKLIKTYGFDKKITILNLRKTDDVEIKVLAHFIYDKVFLNYNLKQWGVKPEELNKSVTSRVPIYTSENDNYFTDVYQGVPLQGYTEMFKRMLNHDNIEVILNIDYSEVINEIKFKKLIYTGQIDTFMNYKFGKLPYRSLSFNFITKEMEYFQETAQVNYPNDYDYTRITEFKYLTGQKMGKTTIAYEFPCEYKLGTNDPYYPIPITKNIKLYEKYNDEAKKIKNTIFIGRLAEYKYYNMDQIVARALNEFTQIANK